MEKGINEKHKLRVPFVVVGYTPGNYSIQSVHPFLRERLDFMFVFCFDVGGSPRKHLLSHLRGLGDPKLFDVAGVAG